MGNTKKENEGPGDKIVGYTVSEIHQLHTTESALDKVDIA
jgi:hypothetical protein